jgi:nucleoside-diphosphate-sugar epimerase
MSRKVCITACDGQTGFLITELLLTHPDFSGKVDSVVGLSLHPRSAKATELHKLGAQVVTHHPGRERDMVKTLKETSCDTICLIPPADKDKYNIVVELISAAKKAGIQKVLFISSAGCDLANPQKQPRLREFIDMEVLVLGNKGDPDTPLSHSPCIIRFVRLLLQFAALTIIL